jgi:hypothetical protein
MAGQGALAIAGCYSRSFRSRVGSANPNPPSVALGFCQGSLADSVGTSNNDKCQTSNDKCQTPGLLPMNWFGKIGSRTDQARVRV